MPTPSLHQSGSPDLPGIVIVETARHCGGPNPHVDVAEADADSAGLSPLGDGELLVEGGKKVKVREICRCLSSNRIIRVSQHKIMVVCHPLHR
ncbi:hypothetical protein D8674_022714 [Pyrus ussuriensis x Pyrus communis]|uniref:Uncharacterized protein n=1 Tax=Pyrus ussuriensis x Pyrus communis TaxID=2448454 RepID=A0A5N5GKN0_9ROSA|nr:hypothetical protein D8674_022714 [Pyrus ussuriensis x Pyrus communis]